MSSTCDAAKFNAEVKYAVETDPNGFKFDSSYASSFIKAIEHYNTLPEENLFAAHSFVQKKCSKICTEKIRSKMVHGYPCADLNASLNLSKDSPISDNPFEELAEIFGLSKDKQA